MSTKTTFKRIALVAVAALGMGSLSVLAAPSASADQALSFSLSQTSITVVGTGNNPKALFAITVTSDTPTVGLSANETITATVVGVPTGVTASKTVAANANDLGFLETKQAKSGTTPITADWTDFTTDTNTALGNAAESTTDGKIGSRNSAYYAMDANLDAAETETARLAKSRTYYFAVVGNTSGGATFYNQGAYTIQFDLTNSAGATIQRTTAKVDFVTTAASSDAKLTAASAGQWFIGDTPTVANQSATRYITATITNRDGGPLRSDTGGPVNLSAQVTDASTTPFTQVMSTADNLTNERAWSTTVASYPNDGTYAIYSSALNAAKGDLTLTVRYGLASATATVAFAAAPTASTVMTSVVTGAGQVAGANAQSANLPLTTKSATVSATVKVGSDAQTGYAAYYTLAYGASCVAGDMAPVKATTPTKLLTDASGVATLTITNAFPLDGCTATVTWTGAVTNPATTSVITWKKAAADKALSNPGGNYKAVLLSAQSVTWTIVDAFGAIMPGATVTISHTGANAPTSAPAARSADAKGQVTYTWTDAKATTTTTDVVSVATVNAVAPVTSAGAVTVSYVATLPVVASIKAQYAATTTLVASTGSPITVPATAIGAAAGGRLIGATDQLDLTKAVTAATADNFVALKFTAEDSAKAAVTGVPMTVTVTNGHILGADLVPTTSRILYANESFVAVGTKTGVATYTATVGTVTTSATILWANASTDARVLSVKESAGTITATVTDFMGNAVSGVSVTASLTAGAGRLGNGATFNTFTTASDGTVSFDVTGAATVTVAIPTTASTKTLNLAGYGDSTGTVVTTGAPAGVRTVAVTTIGNTVVADSAQAAADAAAEATDAANAATDAANAAAEAADAATAAAQDSADAVAALSTQVSEMISALKKQITALTNLVIKIQKKVKA